MIFILFVFMFTAKMYVVYRPKGITLAMLRENMASVSDCQSKNVNVSNKSSAGLEERPMCECEAHKKHESSYGVLCIFLICIIFILAVISSILFCMLYKRLKNEWLKAKRKAKRLRRLKRFNELNEACKANKCRIERSDPFLIK